MRKWINKSRNETYEYFSSKSNTHKELIRFLVVYQCGPGLSTKHKSTCGRRYALIHALLDTELFCRFRTMLFIFTKSIGQVKQNEPTVFGGFVRILFFVSWVIHLQQAQWKWSVSYRAAMPSSNTAARLCKPVVSRFPVNLSHKTCTTVCCRLLPLLKNSCTYKYKFVWLQLQRCLISLILS